MRLTGRGQVPVVSSSASACSAYAGWTYRDRLPFAHAGARSRRPRRPRLRPARRPATAPGAGRRSARACSARVRQTGVLRVGMEPDAPPLHFINDRKQEDGFDFRLAGIIAEGLGAKRDPGRRSRLRGPARPAARRRHRRHHGRLRARSVDRRRRLVERLPRLRPLHDRAARAWSSTYRSVQRPRRQAHRDLRRPGGRALGAAEHSRARRSASSRATTAGSRRSRRDQADALIYDYPFAAEEIKAHPRTIIVQYNLNQSKYAVGDPGRQLRPGLRGQRGDRQLQGDAAVRRPDARVPVELVRGLHEAGRRAQDLHGEGGRHAQQDRRQRAEGHRTAGGRSGISTASASPTRT